MLEVLKQFIRNANPGDVQVYASTLSITENDGKSCMDAAQLACASGRFTMWQRRSKRESDQFFYELVCISSETRQTLLALSARINHKHKVIL